MKVKELIKELEKMNQESEVLVQDNDDWWYDTFGIKVLWVKEGKEYSADNTTEEEPIVGIY